MDIYLFFVITFLVISIPLALLIRAEYKITPWVLKRNRKTFVRSLKRIGLPVSMECDNVLLVEFKNEKWKCRINPTETNSLRFTWEKHGSLEKFKKIVSSDGIRQAAMYAANRVGTLTFILDDDECKTYTAESYRDMRDIEAGNAYVVQSIIDFEEHLSIFFTHMNDAIQTLRLTYPAKEKNKIGFVNTDK